MGIVAKDMRLCQLNHVEGLLRQGRTEKEKNPLPTTKAEEKKIEDCLRWLNHFIRHSCGNREKRSREKSMYLFSAERGKL